MFAGHDESGGSLIERDGKKFKQFYGMSSTTAMQKHVGKVHEYRSSEGNPNLLYCIVLYCIFILLFCKLYCGL